jgi:uncharacterized SAM-binding protein YcdF (DUF218 family)
MDLFFVKKLISLFLHLIPGGLFLLALGVLLAQTRAFRRTGISITLLCIVVLLAASAPFTSNLFINTLEQRFEIMDKPPTDTTLIVTLGNYANNALKGPPNAQLSAASLSRVTESLRLWRQQPNARMLFGGPSRYAMRDFAVQFGVPADLITIDHEVRDTIDEIGAAVTLASDSSGRILVVSSATHLPRAHMIAERAAALGLTNTTVPPHSFAPADFLAAPTTSITMGSSYLSKSDRVLHEYVGMLWIVLRTAVSTKATTQ